MFDSSGVENFMLIVFLFTFDTFGVCTKRKIFRRNIM